VPLRQRQQTETPGPPLIGALLRVPWEVVRERMLAGLHARGFDDLSPAHLNVLQYPGPHDMRPSELAARTHMSKQALNYLLGQMEDSGYLQRRAGEEDQRSRRIHLTTRGHRAIRAIREVVAEVEDDWQEHLGSDDFAVLRALLVRLNAIVGATPRQAD
jgi:DNA-binding MarR family transcriptional regulator